MSYSLIQCSRSRSASTSRANFPNQPEEIISHESKAHQPKPGQKIEDKLQNYQIKVNKRLEVLKKNIEQQKLKELKDKPTILKKSKILAELHDKRLLGFSNQDKEMPKIEMFCLNKEALADQREKNNEVQVKAIEINTKYNKNPKGRTQSLTDFELSETDWKNPEAGEKKEDIFVSNEGSGNVVQRKNENLLKKLEVNHRFFKDELMTPQSIETYADSVEHQVKPIKKTGFIPRVLAPFQVQVSFECGFDLNRFLKRANNN